MITSLKIKNFQSHKNSELQFHKGVNVIVGTSDSGKSAIIRSLRWLAYGKPRGDSFRSYWGGNTSVEVEMKEGIVKRIRTNSEASFLTEKDEVILEFKAAGVDIPEEVIQLLNLDDINLQQQSDKPFLISETSGEVALHFNRMANLEKIDSSTRNVNSLIRGIEADLKYKEKELDKVKIDLKAYTYINQAQTDVESLESLHNQLESTKTSKIHLDKVLTVIDSIQDQITVKTTTINGEGLVLSTLNLYSDLKKKSDSLSTLDNLTYKIEGIEKRIIYCNEIIKADTSVTSLIYMEDKLKIQDNELLALTTLINKIKEINRKTIEIESVESAGGDLDKLLTKVNELKVLKSSLNSLSVVIAKLIDVHNRLYQGQIYLTEHEQKWHDNCPDNCPLCDAKIKH